MLDAKHSRKLGHKDDNDNDFFQKLQPGKLKPEDAQAVAVDRPRHENPKVLKGEPDAVLDGKSVAGRVKVPPAAGDTEKGKEGKKEKEEKEEDDAAAKVEAEFNSILKRSPSTSLHLSGKGLGTAVY